MSVSDEGCFLRNVSCAVNHIQSNFLKILKKKKINNDDIIIILILTVLLAL
jgi:hypothetical protein